MAPDNRAARRRQSAREMRALLEGFVGLDPIDSAGGCRTCSLVLADMRAVPDPTAHDDDCLWRYARAWLAVHHPR